jgi:hypothetical protein
MPRPIPPREPIGDPVRGDLVRIEDCHVLALEPQPEGEVIARGEFMARYALRYLGKPHLSIVPGLLALDYGAMLTGAEAWDFILRKSNLHPRADVLGYRNDGADEMIAVKWLDLAEPVEVLIYGDAAAIRPLASLSALIGPAAGAQPPVPDRLRQYLPQFATIGAWRASLQPNSHVGKVNDHDRE